MRSSPDPVPLTHRRNAVPRLAPPRPRPNPLQGHIPLPINDRQTLLGEVRQGPKGYEVASRRDGGRLRNMRSASDCTTGILSLDRKARHCDERDLLTYIAWMELNVRISRYRGISNMIRSSASWRRSSCPSRETTCGWSLPGSHLDIRLSKIVRP